MQNENIKFDSHQFIIPAIIWWSDIEEVIMCCCQWMIQKTILFGVYKVTTGNHLTNNTHSICISILKNHKTICVNDETQQKSAIFKANTLLTIPILSDTTGIGTDIDSNNQYWYITSYHYTILLGS